MSKQIRIYQDNALTFKRLATCFAPITILILGSACNSWPAVYQVKNPGRRAEAPSVSRSPQLNTVPVNQPAALSPASETQLSEISGQQAAAGTLPLPDLTGPSSAEDSRTMTNESEDASTLASTELPIATSSAPVNSVQLASSQVAVHNANLKSDPTTKLVIAGVRPERGKVKIAIFADSSAFPNPAGASKTFELAGTNPTIETSLPYMKQFAIAVYQDVNADGELNRNRMGIPTEPFAFSNNAMGKRGPPSFVEAAVDHPAETGGSEPLVVSIQLP